ncbi:MAG: hypothetical protein LBR08_07280 [Bacteroidales bacterium]|nr:hypothetical protein [Bacteroidales bacterium]
MSSFFFAGYGFRRLVLLLLLFSWEICRAQFLESGTNPPSVRWQQIHTEHFRVIFPADIPGEGQRAANVLEYIYGAEGKTLRHRPKKIPVVLHNRPAFSNGLVSWAPKRSEWYLTPPQSNYAHDWLEQLALHEFRHVVQTDKLDQGITGVLGWFVGQQAVGAVAGLLPGWFLEGDAVAAETSLSNAGRGRNPAFEMPLRTIALSGKYHSYGRAFFGSYRVHVPGRYELGYQMVAWSRKEYGAALFERAIDYTARRPYLFAFHPFGLGLRRQTGLTVRGLYRQAFDDLTLRWKEQERLTLHEAFTAVNLRRTPLYCSYRSPHYLTDSTFLVLKTGMADVARWVEINRHGAERVIATPGMINSERFSYSCGLMAWSEETPDVRWSNRTYSVIKLLDVSAGKERTLARRTRYFAPSLSPDAATLAVVDIPLDCRSAIVLLDVATGEEKLRVPAPEHVQWQTPSWSRDGNYLLAIANGREGKSIVRMEAATGLFATVLAPSFCDIEYPADGGDAAFFTGHYNGVSNIYAVDYRTKEVWQATASRFGAFDPQPAVSSGRMLMAEYSVDGYNLVETDINREEKTPAEQGTDYSVKLYEALAGEERFNLQDSILPDASYPARPFRKWRNPVHVHSWAPLYYKVNTSDVTSTEFYPGLTLLSQDLTGNMTSSAGYSWRGYHMLHAGVTCKGLYPVIELNIEHGGDRRIYGRRDEELPPRRIHTNVGTDVHIPFNFTRNRYITRLEPRVHLGYNSGYFYSGGTGKDQDGFLESSYSLVFSRYLKTSVRDMAPAWGVVLQTAWKHAPSGSGLFGYMYFVHGRTFLPGLLKHHSLQLSGGWQQQKAKLYGFGSMLAFPRGYATGYSDQLKVGLAEYSFPLLYPDGNLWVLAYLKRISANLFCHAADNRYRLRNGWQSDRMLSVGADILADVHFLQFFFPVNIGIRTIYVPETGIFQSHLLFHIAFDR